MSNLYKVSEGVVSLVSDGTELDHLVNLNADWNNEVLCYSKTEKEALSLAEQYDRGNIQPDNLAFHGVMVVALEAPEQMYMNPNTGSVDTQDGWCYTDEEEADEQELLPQYETNAQNWRLWQEYVDPDATMTEEEFNNLSVDQKIKMQQEIWG